MRLGRAVPPSAAPKALEQSSALIQLRKVCKNYVGPPSVQALVDIDFEVRSGEYISIVGPSGSGKSSLLNVLGLLDVPTSGQYLFNGTETAVLSDKERTEFRSRNLGFIFQAFHLVRYRTVLENVALPLMYQGIPWKARMEAARSKLEIVGLSHRYEALPTRLSGGELQRAAIARALVSEPPLLLCDEPTGNLDAANSRAILESIDALVENGQTVMMITHDREVAERASRTSAIQDGRLARDTGAIL